MTSHDKEVEGTAMGAPSPADVSNPVATARPGTRRWFWQMRIWHLMLWVLPLFPLLYGWVEAVWSDPPAVQMISWSPWVASALALTVVSRALWRVEVNLAGNRRHPFTERDGKVIGMASSWALGAMFYAAMLPVTLVGPWATPVTRAQKDHINGAIDSTMVAMVIVGVLLASFARIHKKARAAYEELERGV